MERKFTSYIIKNPAGFKKQLLHFSKKCSSFCLYDSHQYNFDKSYEWLAGAGTADSFISYEGNVNALNAFHKEKDDWIFGNINYDVKNEIENLHSSHADFIEFPNIYFFVPEIVFLFDRNELQIGVCGGNDAAEVYNDIINADKPEAPVYTKFSFNYRFTKEEYIETVKKLKQHILKGDCYEINFCQEFYAEDVVIDPVTVYQKLSTLSPNPFSAFYKQDNKFLLCASPERFLKRTGDTIISQPIKGTVKRITADAAMDKQQQINLLNNEKERAENIMIVDLVRNDLSKICRESSVYVKELLRIYSFPQVYQMISTIAGKLTAQTNIAEIFRATFPMGSMTGAPKKKVMELIEKYERTRRGLFSGTIGYIKPNGDFDFNVVIRSILYNSLQKYISVQAGSAITFKSIPEEEYEECLLKIAAIKKSFK